MARNSIPIATRVRMALAPRVVGMALEQFGEWRLAADEQRTVVKASPARVSPFLCAAAAWSGRLRRARRGFDFHRDQPIGSERQHLADEVRVRILGWAYTPTARQRLRRAALGTVKYEEVCASTAASPRPAARPPAMRASRTGRGRIRRLAGRPRPSQPADANPGGGATWAEIHLSAARELFRPTEPALILKRYADTLPRSSTLNWPPFRPDTQA